MTAVTDEPTTVDVDEPGDDTTVIDPVDRPDDDSALEQLGDTLMAAPAALLCFASNGVIAGATAWQAGGAAGLGLTAAAGGGTAGAAYLARRAHATEARKRAETEAKKTGKPAPAPTPPKRVIARVPRHARPGAATRTSGFPGSRGGRRGGAGGFGRSAGGGMLGKRKAVGSKVGPAGKPSALGSKGGVRSGFGHTAPTPGSKAGRVGRMVGAGRTPGGGSSPAGAGNRVGGGNRAGVARKAAAAAKRSAAGGGAAVGRKTHAVAGSLAGKAATAAGRRAAGRAKAAGAAARRAHTAGRAAIAGAAAARGKGVRQIAKAARAGLAAARTKQDQARGKEAGKVVRARRWVTGAAVAGAAGLLAGAGIGGRWARWLARAAKARLTGRPIPATPNQQDTKNEATDELTSTHGHPAVGSTVNEPPAHARNTPQGATMATAQLGTLLHDLSSQMAAAATGYDPEGMLQWGADMQALEGVLHNIFEVISALEKGAESEALEPAVVASISAVSALQSACASAAGEIHNTFRVVHADDIARLENPRPNEAKWDTVANQ